MDVMQEILEGRLVNGRKEPIRIWGSGGSNKNTLWLNMRSPAYPSRQGTLKMAINDYFEAFSVRYRHIFMCIQATPVNNCRAQDVLIEAGTAYHIKVVPTVHR